MAGSRSSRARAAVISLALVAATAAANPLPKLLRGQQSAAEQVPSDVEAIASAADAAQVEAAADFEASVAAADAAAAAGGTSVAMGRQAAVHITWHADISFCLSTDGNRIENGVKVQLWQCDTTWGSAGQSFFADDHGRIMMAEDPRYCVVVDGDRLENGAQVQLWQCDQHNEKQVWRWEQEGSGSIKLSHASTSMCLVIDGNMAVNGARIQVWSCSEAGSSAAAQEWIKVALGADRKTMYTVPNTDKACPRPFRAIAQSTTSCVAAAEALRPGSGCAWGDYTQTWSQIVRQSDRPSCPKGCYFYGACRGGCGLHFNPSGHEDSSRSCKDEGNCFSISVICELAA